jgi:hypothetical protein
VDRARFVPEVDHAQRLVIHGVEHVQDVVSGDSEDSVDSLSSQRANQKVTTGGFGHCFSSFEKDWCGKTNMRSDVIFVRRFHSRSEIANSRED